MAIDKNKTMVVPDAIHHTDTSETLEYIQGWNDCRATMLAEQPAQQEPVAWICEGSSSDEKHAIDYWPGDVDDIPIGTKLYTSPAQRTWVELSDEEVDNLSREMVKGKKSVNWLSYSIEAKLKERNA